MSLKMARQVTTTKGKTMKVKMKTTAGPEFEILTITPKKAGEMLANNTHNRSVNVRAVERLVATIVANEWQFNAQPIQVAQDGTLLDGQHRLLACVRANIPIEALVVWNAQVSSQETMDMGKSRSVADILRLRGYKNQSVVAALGRRIAVGQAFGLRYGITNTFREVSPGAVLRAAEKVQDLSRYTVYAKAIADLLNFNSGVTGYLMWWLDSIDRDDSEFFWDKLRTGDGLSEGEPIYALRQFGLTRDTFGRGTYSHNVQTAGVVLKAWNKFREGEPVMRLTFRVGGSRPEELPEPV
jgi:hypothetical protein